MPGIDAALLKDVLPSTEACAGTAEAVWVAWSTDMWQISAMAKNNGFLF